LAQPTVKSIQPDRTQFPSTPVLIVDPNGVTFTTFRTTAFTVTSYPLAAAMESAGMPGWGGIQASITQSEFNQYTIAQ
jgi:hypothetical protein